MTDLKFREVRRRHHYKVINKTPRLSKIICFLVSILVFVHDFFADNFQMFLGMTLLIIYLYSVYLVLSSKT